MKDGHSVAVSETACGIDGDVVRHVHCGVKRDLTPRAVGTGKVFFGNQCQIPHIIALVNAEQRGIGRALGRDGGHAFVGWGPCPPDRF